MADRIAVMDRGKLQQYGSPEDLYERPANTFVARFIGSVLNNFIPARYADGALQIGDGSIALGERRGAFERRDSEAGLTATIRPERVRVVDAGSQEATIRAQVDARRAARAEGRRPPGARGHGRARAAAARRGPAIGSASGSTSTRRRCTSSTTPPAWRCADGTRPPRGRDQAVRRRDGHGRRHARHRRRRVLRHPRAAGRGQDDDCCGRSSGSRSSTPGACSLDDEGHHRRLAGRPRHRDRVPEPRALSRQDACTAISPSRSSSTRLPKTEIRSASASRQGAQDRGAARPQAREALGRRAAARRDRPGDRSRPARASSSTSRSRRSMRCSGSRCAAS